MTHSKTSKFFLLRYDPSTAKPGFFFTQVVGESMNLRMLNAPGGFYRHSVHTFQEPILNEAHRL